MTDSAALLIDEVLPEHPIRQWVHRFPYQLRFLFASRLELMGRVLGIVYRAISSDIFEPLDFIAKLATLVPKPRVNLTRFHGVFAPNSKYRVDVTPAKRGKGCKHHEDEDKTLEQRHKAMTWALRLKRVFNIDVSICSQCGGEARVIACIEDQVVIDKTLQHLQDKGALPQAPELLPATRASPQADWFACASILYRQ
jgi:hypothetical protein